MVFTKYYSAYIISRFDPINMVYLVKVWKRPRIQPNHIVLTLNFDGIIEHILKLAAYHAKLYLIITYRFTSELPSYLILLIFTH